MRRATSLLLLLPAALGCVYYNGVYNTKRLADDARHAERDGRTLEANALWGRVQLQAESTLARHPTSKWTNQTLLLQGTALVRLKDCDRAIPVFDRLLRSSSDPRIVEEAALMDGGCRESKGDMDGASASFERLLTSTDSSRRKLALYQHGRTLRKNGQYEAAIAELRQSDDPRAKGELAAALAGAGQSEAALALSDSLLVLRDSLTPWDSILAGLGRTDREAASTLTDRLVATYTVPETQARFLREDAGRWARADTARAAARLQEAVVRGGKSFSGVSAQLDLVLLRLRGASSGAALAQQTAALDGIIETGGPTTTAAARLSFAVRTVLAAVDSVAADSPQGDLRIFLAGEVARDSLRATSIAVQLLQRIPRDWTESPFAPKALLALAGLVPEQADSLLQVASDAYPGSPYLAVLRGEDPPAFRHLEDSLRVFALNSAAAAGRRPRPVTQPDRAPPTTRQPVAP